MHIPFHLLHVFALLWLSPRSVSTQLGPRAATWLRGALKNESPFGEFHWPQVLVNSRQLEIVPLSRWLKTENLVEATEGLSDLDILSYSSLKSCCGYKSESLVWEALSRALAPGPLMWPEFKVSGPVVLFHQSLVSLVSLARTLLSILCDYC